MSQKASAGPAMLAPDIRTCGRVVGDHSDGSRGGCKGSAAQWLPLSCVGTRNPGSVVIVTFAGCTPRWLDHKQPRVNVVQGLLTAEGRFSLQNVHSRQSRRQPQTAGQRACRGEPPRADGVATRGYWSTIPMDEGGTA